AAGRRPDAPCAVLALGKGRPHSLPPRAHGLGAPPAGRRPFLFPTSFPVARPAPARSHPAMPDASPTADESFVRRHASDWSVDDVRILTPSGAVWLVGQGPQEGGPERVAPFLGQVGRHQTRVVGVEIDPPVAHHHAPFLVPGPSVAYCRPCRLCSRNVREYDRPLRRISSAGSLTVPTGLDGGGTWVRR